MDERMWIYPELKFIIANQYKMDSNELIAEVNGRFHGGESVRCAADIDKVLRGKNIFNKERRQRKG